MDIEWQLRREDLVHEGRLDVVNRTFATPDGEEHSFEVLDQARVVVVLALTVDGQVVLVRQFRPGPERYLTELPAGFVDEGETPAEAAARGLSEETGYAAELREVAQLPSNGYSTEIRHVFVAVDAVPGDAHPDAGEDLEVVTLNLPRLRRLLKEGGMTVTDAAYVGLDSLGLLG